MPSVTVNGKTYTGKRSVIMTRDKIIIDGKEVGVEVDENGIPLTTFTPTVSDLPVASIAVRKRENFVLRIINYIWSKIVKWR